MSRNSTTFFTCFYRSFQKVHLYHDISWHVNTGFVDTKPKLMFAGSFWYPGPSDVENCYQTFGNFDIKLFSLATQVHLESGQRFLKPMASNMFIEDLYVSMSPPFLQWNPKSARDLNKMPADFLPQIMRQLQFINDTTIASTPSLLFPRLVLQMAKLR